MPRKSLFTALVAALAILLAPSVAAAAPSTGSESRTITQTSKTGAKAKASCLPLWGVSAARAAVGFAQHLAKKKAQDALRRAAAKRGASRAVRPISRAAKQVRAGKEAAARRVLLAYLRANQKTAAAVKACFVAGVVNVLAGKSFAEARLSCVGAAAGVLSSD